MAEVAVWVRYYNGNELVGRGLDFRSEMWRGVCEEVEGRWVEWCKMKGKEGGGVVLVPEGTPFGIFAFFEETQGYLRALPDF